MNNDGEIRIGTKIDTSGFEKGAKELKKEAVNVDREVTQVLSKSSKSANGLGKALGGVTKKAISLGSALFNIVAVGVGLGAIGLGAFILGKALDKANGKTDQLKANLSYIGFVASKIFENLLQPAIDKTTGAVNGLVGALYKAVVYIGYILSKWTGKDLFKGTDTKSYAKSMEDANKSAKKTAKSTKQIKKDLMGFDEVNKLTEDTKTGDDKDKITLPNLPNLGNVPIPGWVDWIARNKDTVLKVVGAVMALLTFSKVVSWLEPVGSFFKTLFGYGATSGGGSGLLGVLSKISLIIAGIGVIIKANKSAKEQMEDTANTVDKLNASGTKSTKEFAKSTSDIIELEKERARKQKEVNGLLSDAVWYGSNDLKWTKLNKDAKEQYVKTLNENVLQQHIILQREMELYRQGKLTDEQKKQLIEKLKNQQGIIEDITDGYDEIGEDYGDMIHYQNIYNGYIKEMGGEISKFAVVERDTIGMLMDGANTAQKMEKSLGVSVAEAGALASTKFIDKEMKINFEANTTKANSTLSTFVSNLASSISKAFKNINLDGFKNNIASIFSKLMPNLSIANIKKKLGLRQGGIINVPGRGVSLGSNIIGGEAGAEAVLPLNDTTMDRLGEAIARHMNVNLTNVTEMNGRTISRELKKISNENNFSYNG